MGVRDSLVQDLGEKFFKNEPGCLSVTQGEDRVPRNGIDEIVGY